MDQFEGNAETCKPHPCPWRATAQTGRHMLEQGKEPLTSDMEGGSSGCMGTLQKRSLTAEPSVIESSMQSTPAQTGL